MPFPPLRISGRAHGLCISGGVILAEGMQILFPTLSSGLGDTDTGSGTAGSRGGSAFHFVRNHLAVFHSGTPVCVPTQRARGLPCLRILSNTRHFFFFHTRCSGRCEGHLVCVLICISLVTSGVGRLFTYLHCPSVCPLWRTVYSGPLPTFKSGRLSHC